MAMTVKNRSVHRQTSVWFQAHLDDQAMLRNFREPHNQSLALTSAYYFYQFNLIPLLSSNDHALDSIYLVGELHLHVRSDVSTPLQCLCALQ